MMKDSSYTIYCPKCGGEMKNTSRCCMKCGFLNPEHPSNKNSMKYFQNVQDNYSTSGTYVISNEHNKSSNLKFLTSNMKSCFIFNIILFLLTMIFITGYYYLELGSISHIISSDIWIPYIFISIFFLFYYAYELLFIKMGCSWWKSLIPIYNVMLISKKVFDNSLLGLLALIPFVGQIFILVLLYKLACKFKRNGILMILFPEIMFPIISFSEDTFDNFEFNYDDNYEHIFGLKKKFILLCLLFIIVGLLIVIFKFPIIDYFKGKWQEVRKIIG